MVQHLNKIQYRSVAETCSPASTDLLMT